MKNLKVVELVLIAATALIGAAKAAVKFIDHIRKPPQNPD